MHVAIICRGLGVPGSVAAVALRQARELTRYGRVTLVSDSLPRDAEWASFALAPILDLGFLRRFRHVPDEILFTRAASRKLLEVHRRDPLDFVLCQSHAAADLTARPFREKTGVKCGVFVHGDIFERPKGTFDSRLTAFYRWVERRAYQGADVVFVLAAAFVEVARRHGARHVEIIPNGVDPADIGLNEPHDSIRDEGPLRVLSVGRLSVEKGFIHLIEACSRVNADYTLDIVGGGPLAASIRDAIYERGLTSRVRLLGTMPRENLGEVYRQHHVFCTPAISEPFALVILEALVSGLPVIGTRVGGIPEVVQHEKNGLLVEAGNADALASAITRLAFDEPFRHALATNARSSVLPRLSWPAIGDRLASAIRMHS